TSPLTEFTSTMQIRQNPATYAPNPTMGINVRVCGRDVRTAPASHTQGVTIHMRQIIVVATLAMVWCAVGATRAQAQVGTAFTYQGELVQGVTPVNGTADFRCSLWDSETLGLQYGSVIELGNVPVTNGVFVLKLDFGAALYLSPAK